MKKFEELTKEQQNRAIEIATKEMKECADLGILAFNEPISESIIARYARDAAEGSLYSDSGFESIKGSIGEKYEEEK